jgi:hypothetical protein
MLDPYLIAVDRVRTTHFCVQTVVLGTTTDEGEGASVGCVMVLVDTQSIVTVVFSVVTRIDLQLEDEDDGVRGVDHTAA